MIALKNPTINKYVNEIKISIKNKIFRFKECHRKIEIIKTKPKITSNL